MPLSTSVRTGRENSTVHSILTMQTGRPDDPNDRHRSSRESTLVGRAFTARQAPRKGAPCVAPNNPNEPNVSVRDAAPQFFEPIQYDVDLVRRRIRMQRLDAEETPAVSRDVIGGDVVRTEQVAPFEQ